MHQTVENVGLLENDKIQSINKFLQSFGMSGFDNDAILFLQDPHTSDPLGLRLAVRFVRGYFLDHSVATHSNLFHQDINGKDYDELLDEYKASLNPDDYSEEDYKGLVAEAKEEFKDAMVKHALILGSTNSNTVDLLLLNREMKPLNIVIKRF